MKTVQKFFSKNVALILIIFLMSNLGTWLGIWATVLTNNSVNEVGLMAIILLLTTIGTVLLLNFREYVIRLKELRKSSCRGCMTREACEANIPSCKFSWLTGYSTYSNWISRSEKQLGADVLRDLLPSDSSATISFKEFEKKFNESIAHCQKCFRTAPSKALACCGCKCSDYIHNRGKNNFIPPPEKGV